MRLWSRLTRRPPLVLLVVVVIGALLLIASGGWLSPNEGPGSATATATGTAVRISEARLGQVEASRSSAGSSSSTTTSKSSSKSSSVNANADAADQLLLAQLRAEVLELRAELAAVRAQQHQQHRYQRQTGQQTGSVRDNASEQGVVLPRDPGPHHAQDQAHVQGQAQAQTDGGLEIRPRRFRGAMVMGMFNSGTTTMSDQLERIARAARGEADRLAKHVWEVQARPELQAEARELEAEARRLRSFVAAKHPLPCERSAFVGPSGKPARVDPALIRAAALEEAAIGKIASRLRAAGHPEPLGKHPQIVAQRERALVAAHRALRSIGWDPAKEPNRPVPQLAQEYLWKHVPPGLPHVCLRPDILYVVMVRHPISWTTSTMRKPWSFECARRWSPSNSSEEADGAPLVTVDPSDFDLGLDQEHARRAVGRQPRYRRRSASLVGGFAMPGAPRVGQIEVSNRIPYAANPELPWSLREMWRLAAEGNLEPLQLEDYLPEETDDVPPGAERNIVERLRRTGPGHDQYPSLDCHLRQPVRPETPFGLVFNYNETYPSLLHAWEETMQAYLALAANRQPVFYGSRFLGRTAFPPGKDSAGSSGSRNAIGNSAGTDISNSDSNTEDNDEDDVDTAHADWGYPIPFEYDQPNVVLVRYEDYVLRPEEVVRGLMRLLGLPQRLFHPKMIPEGSRARPGDRQRSYSVAKLATALQHWEAPYLPARTCRALGYQSCSGEGLGETQGVAPDANFVLHDDALAMPVPEMLQ